MNWLHRILGIDQLSQGLAGAQTGVLDAFNEAQQEQKKSQRRLALAQQQQHDAIEQLRADVAILAASLAQQHGVPLEYPQLIEHLDQLEKLGQLHSGDESFNHLLTQTIDMFRTYCGLEPLATLGEPYPEQACEVVAALPSDQHPPGRVHQILQQGYRSKHGQIVRFAKVVVYRKADDAAGGSNQPVGNLKSQLEASENE